MLRRIRTKRDAISFLPLVFVLALALALTLALAFALVLARTLAIALPLWNVLSAKHFCCSRLLAPLVSLAPPAHSARISL